MLTFAKSFVVLTAAFVGVLAAAADGSNSGSFTRGYAEADYDIHQKAQVAAYSEFSDESLDMLVGNPERRLLDKDLHELDVAIAGLKVITAAVGSVKKEFSKIFTEEETSKFDKTPLYSTDTVSPTIGLVATETSFQIFVDQPNPVTKDHAKKAVTINGTLFVDDKQGDKDKVWIFSLTFKAVIKGCPSWFGSGPCKGPFELDVSGTVQHVRKPTGHTNDETMGFILDVDATVNITNLGAKPDFTEQLDEEEHPSHHFDLLTENRLEATCCETSDGGIKKWEYELKGKHSETRAPTKPPTEAPSGTISPTGFGEPHFRTWSGEAYDFQGVCDLVLLENQRFGDGSGMNIHIRTKKYKQHWSYIANAVLQIGEETLEVAAGNDGSSGQYWMNGVAGRALLSDKEGILLDETIYGYSITYRRPTTKTAEFEIDFGDGSQIVIKTWGKFVRVNINGVVSGRNYEGSRGLLGTIEGVKVARDNVTILEDPNEFGQEWQVLPSEPKLFHNLEGPQQPQKCIIPSAVDTRRRLRESGISQDDAALACSGVVGLERDPCIFDVMATNDLDVAQAYW